MPALFFKVSSCLSDKILTLFLNKVLLQLRQTWLGPSMISCLNARILSWGSIFSFLVGMVLHVCLHVTLCLEAFHAQRALKTSIASMEHFQMLIQSTSNVVLLIVILNNYLPMKWLPKDQMAKNSYWHTSWPCGSISFEILQQQNIQNHQNKAAGLIRVIGPLQHHNQVVQLALRHWNQFL